MNPPVHNVVLATTYQRPDHGWPAPVTSEFGETIEPERITISATAGEGGVEVLDLIEIIGTVDGLRGAASVSLRTDRIPPYVRNLIAHAKEAAATALAVA